MDSRRKELYVEGRRDRLFFNWLLGKNRHPDTVIHEIDSVGIEAPHEGGNRGKLFFFAQAIAPHKLAVRCFADADFDRILNRQCPDNIWLTDSRDLEGYFLQVACIEKVLRLAMACERLNPESVLSEVRGVARQLGVLRLLSAQRNLKLPFQERPLKPYVKRSKDRVALDFDSYLQSLLQGAKISLKELGKIKSDHLALVEATNGVDERQLLHGKDCLAVLCVLLKTDEFKETAVEPSCWASLDREVLKGFPNLEAALAYLGSTKTKQP